MKKTHKTYGVTYNHTLVNLISGMKIQTMNLHRRTPVGAPNRWAEFPMGEHLCGASCPTGVHMRDTQPIGWEPPLAHP